MADETKKLFHEDVYKIEFEAHVVEKYQHEQKFVFILDQTCFYPESGGQPSDKGTLNGVEVVHVEERKGEILHVLNKDISETKVFGKIDWEKRFDHMQQHAGQHILSQSLFELFQAKTLSFHLGAELSTIEFDLREISDEEWNEACRNTAIAMSLDNESLYPKSQSLIKDHCEHKNGDRAVGAILSEKHISKEDLKIIYALGQDQSHEVKISDITSIWVDYLRRIHNIDGFAIVTTKDVGEEYKKQFFIEGIHLSLQDWAKYSDADGIIKAELLLGV